MPVRTRTAFSTRGIRPVTQIEFHRTKYGPELLVDCCWIHEIPTFFRTYPHSLDAYDLVLITRGRGWCFLDSHRHAVRPGQVIFTTPGQVRDWQARGVDGISLFFHTLFLDDFYTDAMFLHRMPFFHGPPGSGQLLLSRAATAELRQRLVAMRGEILRLRPDSTHLLRAQLYETLVILARRYAATHRQPAHRVPHRLTVSFQEMVERHARQRHTVTHYARALAVSPNHLNAVCRQHLGRSAKNVIQERLAVEARRLLLYSDESAERIGYLLGFRDPSYFTRFFRRESGRTPSAFRASFHS